ncbi:MAG: hypothetical protein H7A37_07825 [Chlamydiales bacterium]|nr:hypothetical protein [Chlamydiia bacterium]MCP5508188.1 hypothetical protein [Chlamydiales bacterium]
MGGSAKESHKIAKVRKKLEKVLKEEQKKINPESLKEMSKSIQSWLNRHEEERVDIKTKSFTHFSGDLEPAQTKSRYVQQLLDRIKNESEYEEEVIQKVLRGRIKIHPSDN